MAEMGADMERFPTPGHLASWAGVCPGNNRSGDKSKRGPTRKGNSWLKPALVEAARAAARTKTYLGAQYRRLARRIGAGRAAIAVAHSIAVILHHVIRTGQPFVDLGIPVFRGAGSHRHHPPSRTPPRKLGPQGHPPTRLNPSIFMAIPHAGCDRHHEG